jgi:hypothetical protein
MLMYIRMCMEKNAKEVVWIWTSSYVKLATIGVCKCSRNEKRNIDVKKCNYLFW